MTTGFPSWSCSQPEVVWGLSAMNNWVAGQLVVVCTRLRGMFLLEPVPAGSYTGWRPPCGDGRRWGGKSVG